MGNYLKVPDGCKSDKKLLKFFRKMNLTSVFERFEWYSKHYHPRVMLTEEEFDETFSPLLYDCQTYFKKLSLGDTANFFEAFIALSIFAKGEFDRKLKGIFMAFDVDGSGFMDKKELQLFINTAIFGLCKLLGLPLPRRDDVQQFTYATYKQVDSDGNDQIDIEEFFKWIKESDEIQDFLLKYTGSQTVDRAKKRYRPLLDSYKEIFDKIAIEFMGENYATIDELKSELSKAMPEIAPHILERLFLILDYENKGAVSEFEFFIVMKPWASFSATDINNDNELDAAELKTLLWLLDDVEPKEARVQRDLKMMDRDGSGTIDRLEWIQYLASPDPETGGMIFDFKLKKSFDMNDTNRDGVIDLDELAGVLMDRFTELIAEKTPEEKRAITNLVKSLAKDIMRILDSRKEGFLDWSAFKNFNALTREREQKILDYIKHH